MDIKSFYKGKKVLVTGHTGFKGSWLCHMLNYLGAEVTGYSLKSPTEPSLFETAGIEQDVKSVIGDIRDFEHLQRAFDATEPEIVFHLAAQPLVRESYKSPRFTYETNVMGTVNIMECVRHTKSVKSVVNVTTDKVYRNPESGAAFTEDDELDGYDPYSNSKSCSELVTHSYVRSFFLKFETSEKMSMDSCGRMKNFVPAVSTARAGNVIGGGDFSENRIIPDCIRAAEKEEDIIIRNPYSVRPFQHVLEPLYAYLLIAAGQYEDDTLAGAYNVGPESADCVTTGELADIFVNVWGEGLKWVNKADDGPHEAGLLRLDCTKIKSRIGWNPRWNVKHAVEKTVEWEKCRIHGQDIRECMDRQIEEYLGNT